MLLYYQEIGFTMFVNNMVILILLYVYIVLYVWWNTKNEYQIDNEELILIPFSQLQKQLNFDFIRKVSKDIKNISFLKS